MHVLVTAPIAGDDVRKYLRDGSGVPRGYQGAPLTAILIGELLHAGHRVTGLTTDPALPLGSGPHRFEGPGFTFIVCPERRRSFRFNGLRPGRIVDLFAVERRQLAQAIVEAAPDIVHAHWSYEFALAAIAQQTAPHLITCHDSPMQVLRFMPNAYRALRYVMARLVFKRARHLSTVSEYMAHELAPRVGYKPQVVPNPVAGELLELGRPRTAPSARRLAMVCNGWDRRKNPEPAMRAFQLWRANEPTAELHLFGAAFGPGESAEVWARAQGLAAAMHFHGQVPHAKLVGALQEMDALLHPALEESFGVVIAEAMALGLPIVAGERSGAVPWVLGTDAAGRSAAGVLVDVRSPAAIAQGLRTAFDDGYAARSLAGVRRAREYYSPEAVSRSYEAIYQRILHAPAKPSPLATAGERAADQAG